MMSDLTRRSKLFDFDATHFVGDFYNAMSWSRDTFNVMPGSNATLG